jgi:SNF2 family DNA or RNA helicase
LIIAPLRVANSVWLQECKKWSHLKHLKIAVATGSERERIKALNSGASIVVINRENIVWLVNYVGRKWPFDFVGVDESSSFKTPKSKRFRALKKVRKLIDRIVLLTGTPAPNGLLDLWSQQYLIDFGLSLGRTYTGYKQRFFSPDYSGFNWTIKDCAADSIRALINDFWLSMSADDYLTLPKRVDSVLWVDMPPSVQARYNKFEKELLSILDSGEIIDGVSAGVLAGKLLQWCNGAVYYDDTGAFEVLHNAKLDALAEIIEDNSEPMLIGYWFKSDLERLKARFPSARVLDKKQSTIDDWNSGKIKLLLAHPQSAGHGLNLQDGGALCVWFSLCWGLEYYQQFNARLHRQGQQKPVRVMHIATSCGIDEKILSVLRDKDATQKDLLSALKNN